MNVEKGIEIANWLGKDQDVYIMEGLKKLEDKGEHFITFWGHYSAGKSRLINNIVGRDILPVQSRESTAALTYVRYGDLEQCIIHFLDKSENVRRHIVGGANRTLFSMNLPPRLCRIGTCRILSAE